MFDDTAVVLLMLILIALTAIFFMLNEVKKAIEDNTDWHRDNYEGER
jgi:hypothetical protein